MSGIGAVSLPYTGFGTEFLDLDLDGDLDLAIANGRVRRTPQARAPADEDDPFLSVYGETNLLLENVGSGQFREFCEEADDFCTVALVSRGLVAGDVDLDGDLDLLVTNSNGKAQILRNDSAAGNWLSVRAVGRMGKRDEVGALVRIRNGYTWRTRPILYSRSYLSSGDAEAHFGLGEASTVDEIMVVWPDGQRERFGGSDANRRLVLRRGSARK